MVPYMKQNTAADIFHAAAIYAANQVRNQTQVSIDHLLQLASNLQMSQSYLSGMRRCFIRRQLRNAIQQILTVPAISSAISGNTFRLWVREGTGDVSKITCIVTPTCVLTFGIALGAHAW